jgi:hypothetical protein
MRTELGGSALYAVLAPERVLMPIANITWKRPSW